MPKAGERNRQRGDVNEIKNADQIVKQRLRLEFIKRKQNSNTLKKAANRKKHMKKSKQKQNPKKWWCFVA